MNAIAGAAILAERFGASADADRPAPPAAPPPGALPIFHWIGVEPSSESECPPVSDSSGS
jgi:hypothetical protein